MRKINQKSPNRMPPYGTPAANDNVAVLEQNSNITKAVARSWRRHCLACRNPFEAESPLLRVCPACKGQVDWQENLGHYEFHPPPPEMEEDE